MKLRFKILNFICKEMQLNIHARVMTVTVMLEAIEFLYSLYSRIIYLQNLPLAPLLMHLSHGGGGSILLEEVV